ncbi:MAG: hypothetical protein R2794_03445 [Chitinophagales bacterium]
MSVLLLAGIVIAGCDSMPGDGGTSSIRGKVYVQVYNESNILYQQYYVQDEKVFLIYGDGTTFDDDTRTSYDGSYSFKYLRKGTYQVYAYSDCPTCVNSGLIEPILLEVEITKNNQEVVLPDIVIEKH